MTTEPKFCPDKQLIIDLRSMINDKWIWIISYKLHITNSHLGRTSSVDQPLFAALDYELMRNLGLWIIEDIFLGEGRRVVRGVNIMFHKTKLVLSQFAGKIKLVFHVSWQKRPLFDPNAHNLWLEKFICPKHSFDVFIICLLPVLCGAKPLWAALCH